MFVYTMTSPLKLKNVSYNFISGLCHKCCFRKCEYYALQTPKTDATINQPSESLTIPELVDWLIFLYRKYIQVYKSMAGALQLY